MDMLEVHAKARLCANKLYNDFLYRLKPNKKQIFVFYEGNEDSSFYRKFLEIPGYTVEELVSGCRNNVLKNYHDLKECGYDVEHMLFIIDRDLSFWLGETIPESDIFVTDGYSVENYIVCDEVFEKLITQIKGFARCNKQEVEYMCLEFSRVVIEFVLKMQYIMACAVIAKIKDRNAELSAAKCSKFLDISLEDGVLEINITKPTEILSCWGITKDDDEDIQRFIRLFQKHNDQYHVRGKWLLTFMVEVSEKMRLNARTFATSLNIDKATQTCVIETTRAVGVLGPRCTEIPVRFKQYLEGRIS